MTPSPSSSSTIDTIIVTAAATSLCLGFATVLLQLDAVSRRILSPEKLRLRRRIESLYRLDEFQKASFRRNRERTSSKSNNDSADFVFKEEDVTALVQTIVGATTTKSSAGGGDSCCAEIVAIELDEEDERNVKEWFLFLALESTTDGGGERRMVQVPLIRFCQSLADAFEKVVTSTTFCFVADASAGLGGQVLGRVLKESEVGAGIVMEPTWMLAIAQLAQKRLIQTENLKKIMFALCRLEAHRLRDQIGAARTIVIFLPGQITTPILLPLLQSTFPCERHLFTYDTCANTLRRAHRTPSPLITAPLSPLRSRPLATPLSKLPRDDANAVETWMSSVDAFLNLKNATERKEDEYLPFVHRLGFLMGETNVIGHGDSDVSELALANVLQFVTGSKSRPLKEDVVTRAKRVLVQFRAEDRVAAKACGRKITEVERILVEDCVFNNKQILIGDKTLLDTVQPATEWTLKAAKKITGCSCCAPEEEEEDEEEESRTTTGVNGTDLSMPGAFANRSKEGLVQRRGTMTKSRSKYVDGKMGFAFDPTAFS